MKQAPHIPVMIEEIIRSLAITPSMDVVDGTFGAGGYSERFLAAGARVYAFDRDPDAQARGSELSGRYGGMFSFHPACFSSMDTELHSIGIESVDAIVLDIGVSSMQLDQAERGFSFQSDGPLDMRMSQDGQSAADFLNEANEETIADIIYNYGDERRSRRIAKYIVSNRPIERTAQLASIVRRAVGYQAGAPKDPATRTFQAIRIHINQELEELSNALVAAERLLRPGGQLIVITFHSLEDRIVKKFMRRHSGTEVGGSRHMPVTKQINKAMFSRPAKPIKASSKEIAMNPRARSATMRVAVRNSISAVRDMAGVKAKRL